MANSIQDIAAAIQQMEGWFPGSVAYRNNNPGNLRAGNGQVGTDPNGYAIFPDYQTGYNALVNQVQVNVNRGLTLQEFFAGKPGVYSGYAPSIDNNNPTNYANFVSDQTGIPTDIPLNEWIGGTGSADHISSAFSSVSDFLSSGNSSIALDTSSIFGVNANVVLMGIVVAGIALLLFRK